MLRGKRRNFQSGQINVTPNQAKAQPIKVSKNLGMAAAIAEPSRLKLINAKMVIKAVACAYCLLRNSKNRTPLNINMNSCPSVEGIKKIIARPTIIPTNVPTIRRRKRRLVALKLGWLTNRAVSIIQ
ncbi:hypothetical protein D9M71_504740 [compost metagenome]